MARALLLVGWTLTEEEQRINKGGLNMDQRNTEFGIETPFSSINVGDTILIFDSNQKTHYMGKADHHSDKNPQMLWCVGEDGIMFPVLNNEKIWVVKELRIKAVEYLSPNHHIYSLFHKTELAYIAWHGFSILTSDPLKTHDFCSYRAASKYLQKHISNPADYIVTRFVQKA